MQHARKLFSLFLVIAALTTVGASGQTLTPLHSFSGSDGAVPGIITDGGSGTFFLTVLGGSTHGFGAVVSVSTDGSFTNIYPFQGGGDGQEPVGLALGSNGKLYGSTDSGGTGGGGTIYDLTLNGTLNNIMSFSTDTLGNAQSPGFIKGIDGKFYGSYTRSDGPEYTTIFQMDEAGTIVPLHTSNGYDGGQLGGLVQVAGGDLYGVMQWGGNGFDGNADSGYGTFFRLTTGGLYTNLYLFTGGTNGSSPHALIQADNNDFYGLTSTSSGADETDTVFRVTSSGNLTTVLTFDRATCRFPVGFMQASDHNFYGTMLLGGPGYNGTNGGKGIVYKLNGSTFSTVFSFAGTNGQAPYLLMESSGNSLIGTTALGGSGSSGTVYRLDGVIVSSSSPAITTSGTLPAGTVGTPYNTSLAATGGTLPYDWTIQSGALPLGLGLVASSGAITGTPSAATDANFTGKVTDNNNHSDTQVFTLSVTTAVTTNRIIGLSGSLAFGSVTTGTTATATMTITNTGNSTLTVTDITYPTAFSGAFSGAIPAGGSHGVVVTFAPLTAGLSSGLVTIVSDATSGTSTINASGTGITTATTALPITKMSMKLSFSKPNKDACSVTASLDLGANFDPTGQTAVVTVGGVQLSFPLSTKGAGVSGSSSFKLKAPKAPSTIWTATIAYKSGTFATDWAAFGLANATIAKPGTPVTVPVEVDLNSQVFTGNSPTMAYTAKAGKSGSAK